MFSHFALKCLWTPASPRGRAPSTSPPRGFRDRGPGGWVPVPQRVRSDTWFGRRGVCVGEMGRGGQMSGLHTKGALTTPGKVTQDALSLCPHFPAPPKQWPLSPHSDLGQTGDCFGQWTVARLSVSSEDRLRRPRLPEEPAANGEPRRPGEGLADQLQPANPKRGRRAVSPNSHGPQTPGEPSRDPSNSHADTCEHACRLGCLPGRGSRRGTRKEEGGEERGVWSRGIALLGSRGPLGSRAQTGRPER